MIRRIPIAKARREYEGGSRNFLHFLLSLCLCVSVAQSCGLSFAQAPGTQPQPASAGDLKAEARKPTFYPFSLGQKITVHERAVPEDFGGIVVSPLEAMEIEFKFDEKDNHLTATVSCTVVRVLDCVRTVHVALYDDHQRLLGTACASTTIKRFFVRSAPASEPVELALDFGESVTFKASKCFQLSFSGRGKSSAKYGMNDVDELFTRLANTRSPEGQRDSANALAALGEPVLPRLQALAAKENALGRLALEAIAKIRTPAAAAVLDAQLRSADISDGRRVELYDLLSTMGGLAFEPLSAELDRTNEEGLEIPAVRALGVLNDPRVGPFLTHCLRNDKKYYGRPRAEIAVALQRCNEKAAVPDLISALRDPSGTVRTAVAYAVEELTSASVPIEWDGPQYGAWMNAPPEARELAVKRWEEWWKANRAKFGLQ